MDDMQFRQLLQYLDLSWRGYRKVRKGVKKRIRRHMQELGCRDMWAYLDELGKNDKEKKHCERSMTVSISRFFRDRKLWEVLGEKVLPELIEEQKGKIDVWSAGCSSGEEVYSLKIIWDSLKSKVGHLPELDIVATDINPVCLQRARDAIYPFSSLKELPAFFRPLYFHEESDRNYYQVKDFLKQGISWQKHLLGSDPPGHRFHIIFLRNNLLTYYQDEFKKAAFVKIVNSLTDGGILIIGAHEELPFQDPCLLPYHSLSYVFKLRSRA